MKKLLIILAFLAWLPISYATDIEINKSAGNYEIVIKENEGRDYKIKVIESEDAEKLEQAIKPCQGASESECKSACCYPLKNSKNNVQEKKSQRVLEKKILWLWNSNFSKLIFFTLATALGAGLTYFFAGLRDDYIGKKTAEEFNKGMKFYEDKKYSKAIQVWRPLAEKGYGKTGIVIKIWKFLAGKIKESWGDNGYADAQFYLGLMYERGDGVLQNYDTAIEWYRKAADQKNAEAQNNLGKIYKTVKKEYKEAVKWLTKAANQGNARGQNNLGFMHNQNLGVDKQDNQEAFEWYIKAAEQGLASAQNNIGYMYSEGLVNGNSNPEEAVKWLRQSAKQGDEAGQYNLACMYQNGRGVAQSNTHAYKWFYIADKNGDEVAKNKLDELHQVMNQKEIEKAEEMANRWLGSNSNYLDSSEPLDETE